MKKFFLLIALTIGMYGCAEIQKRIDSPPFYSPQEKKLDLAKRLITENKMTAATETLVSICSAKGVPGVTDEALFRLALLYLGTGQGKGEMVQAQQMLEKLQKEYPSSSWKTHAASLTGLIATLNRRIRSLRGENVSLSRENRELRLNIEKLKILDVEQELKGKR
jgi:cell division protein FtsB